MLKTLFKQEAMQQPDEPREGDLYRRVELFGKVFDLRYGYYEEKDRRGPPDIIYPNFIKEPVYTQDGIPFTIRKAPYIERDTTMNRLTFEMDCVDFELYCKNMCLSLTPVRAN